MGIKVITPPAAEPISALECWRHLRLDGAFDNPPVAPADAADIAAKLAAARDLAEQFTERSIATQTLELALDRFPCDEIELPRGPVQSIVSVSYVDADRVEQLLDAGSHVVDDYGDTAWLFHAIDGGWPATAGVVNAVKVRYVAGYQAPDADPLVRPLPPLMRAAILLGLGYFYEAREITELPSAALGLLQPFRLNLGV